MEAAISNGSPSPTASHGSGLKSAVHPAIHRSEDESIRVDGPLFDREGRVVRSDLEVDLHESARERSMRMHPAGKAHVYAGSEKKDPRPDVVAVKSRRVARTEKAAEGDDRESNRRRSKSSESSTRSADSAGPSARSGNDSVSLREADSVKASGSSERVRERAQGRSARCTAHRVRPGDSLWSIAAEALSTADIRRIARYWPKIHRHNVDVIGSNPDLIYPGQVLELPNECAD